MKTIKLSVSWHPSAKQFVRYVGYSQGRDGKPKPHCFYLGNDEAEAVALAVRLKADWTALKTSGASAWPLTYLETFKRARTQANATVGRLANGLTADETVKGETVADVRMAYLAEQRARMEAKQVSTAFYRQLEWRLTVALDRLPTDADLLGKPMRAVGESDVQRAVLHWASLPMGKIRNQSKRATTGKWVGYRWRKSSKARQKRTVGKPIGVVYAKHLIASIKMMFTWSHETERWDMPRRFSKLFKVKFPKRHVEAERFTVDELKSIYAACQSDRHRLWILLGLNAGLDRTGLATLDWSMVKGLDTERPYIERLRHKTGVYSKHLLWGETVKLLQGTPTRDRHGLVCLTERGEPLVVSTASKDRDATNAAWRIILDRSGARRLSYGKLRKTGAWMVKVSGGLEVSEMYLAHVEVGMNKHYAGRDWGKLDAALTAIRGQLSPM